MSVIAFCRSKLYAFSKCQALNEKLYMGGEVIIDALNGDVINVNPIN